MKATAPRFGSFAKVITSIDEVTAILGTPMPESLAKATDHLDEICRAFIARSPFCLIASSDPDGFIEVSPRGDPPGFARVLDEKHLAIPDRPGNRRVDTFRNLFKDPRVGLIFVIPGKRETLRIAGQARVVRDEQLRRSLAVNEKVPELTTVVYVERVFSHCPKCMVRSNLWNPAAWPDHSQTASHFRAMVEHGKLEISPEQLRSNAEKQGTTRLY